MGRDGGVDFFVGGGVTLDWKDREGGGSREGLRGRSRGGTGGGSGGGSGCGFGGESGGGSLK